MTVPWAVRRPAVAVSVVGAVNFEPRIFTLPASQPSLFRRSDTFVSASSTLSPVLEMLTTSSPPTPWSAGAISDTVRFLPIVTVIFLFFHWRVVGSVVVSGSSWMTTVAVPVIVGSDFAETVIPIDPRWSRESRNELTLTPARYE